jgi:hypothetical protein
MKRNARSAFNALKKIGAPVYEGKDWGGEYFILSAEENEKEIWADYYDGMNIPGWLFGVNPKVTKVLDKFGLVAEWINPGVLRVYDA